MKTILCGSISVSYDLWLPYSSGCLISHALHHCDTSRIDFPEPLYKWLPDDELRQRLSRVDILCLTCYVWNHEYNLHIAGIFKQINPDGVAILGGPEIPLDASMHDSFASARPQIDCFVVGPGEHTFARMVDRIADGPSSWPNCFGHGWSNVTARPKQIGPEDMPQPYLDGIFDGIVRRERRIKASFETNRGCPYKCAFCDWGGQANDVVVKFPLEMVHKAIDWIYANPSISEIEILDANFGMHKRDLETVRYMLDAKKATGNNPNVSYSGLVKNGSPHLAEIIRIIHNELGAERRHLKLSFQTHSKTTLDTVLRDNIDNARLLRLLRDLRHDDIKVSSEMIIGMPGETADSWLQSQQTDYDHGIGFMRTYILNLVCNTRLYDRDYREKYQIRSKRILIPYSMKRYHKETLITDADAVVPADTSFETSEIVHSCHSFDTEELVRMFRYFWYYHNFFNSKALTDTIAHLNNRGMGIVDQVHAFYERCETHEVFRSIIAKQDRIVRKIFGDEPETVLDDYSSYRFFSGSLRTDDLYRMLMRRGDIHDALMDIFRSADPGDAITRDISRWLPYDMPMRAMADRLLGMGSSMRFGDV